MVNRIFCWKLGIVTEEPFLQFELAKRLVKIEEI